MRDFVLTGGTAATILGALALLSACTDPGTMSCERIGEEAKTISGTQPIQIASIANARETSRTDAETRCTADAQLSDGRDTTLYLRAYNEGGNVMVAYQETEF